jgi:hypothetical protein
VPQRQPQQYFCGGMRRSKAPYFHLAVGFCGEESVVGAGANFSDRNRRIPESSAFRCLTKIRIYRKFDVCFPEVKQAA